jgi:hypothetical protein
MNDCWFDMLRENGAGAKLLCFAELEDPLKGRLRFVAQAIVINTVGRWINSEASVSEVNQQRAEHNPRMASLVLTENCKTGHPVVIMRTRGLMSAARELSVAQ